MARLSVRVVRIDYMHVSPPISSGQRVVRIGGVTVPSPTSWQKEQFSIAYIHAVATRGGFTIGSWKVDKDGVDVTLRSNGLMVDMQLKCTCSPTTLQDGSYSFQLDTPTYDKLRSKDRSAPGYLGLMIAPNDVDEWLVHDPKRLLLACHGYWARIQDLEDPAVGDSKAIRIDPANVLDAPAMGDMFADARRLVRRAVA